MKLGVFDSGIGGEAVAISLQKNFSDAEIIVVNDKANMPYGNKSLVEVTRLTDSAIQPLLDARCDVIILACNTATAAAIETIRQKYPHQLFIGLEPMIKPAAGLTRTGVIAVCATPATLSSERYRSLKKRFADEQIILEPNCGDWAYMIEKNDINLNSIANTIRQVCNHGADIIVLACTHYHWIKDFIMEVADDNVVVIDPSDSISRRIKELLS